MDYIMFRIVDKWSRAFVLTMLDFFNWYNLTDQDAETCKRLEVGQSVRLVDQPFTVARVH